MAQWLEIWSRLTLRRRIIISAATLSMFIGIIVIAQIAARPNYSLLFAGLDDAAAGKIIASLEQSGTQYEVRGKSIYVENSQRDQLRLSLAAEGLPAQSGQGYEILDNLTGFGTTSQMFDAAYWRAKEGELARTLAANPQFRSARVHIATPGTNPFLRMKKVTASVLIDGAHGPITKDQARAIQYLTAAAVAGMVAADVAVIDANGGLIDGASQPNPQDTNDTLSEELRQRVLRLAEAKYGFGNAVVEVNVVTDQSQETLREKVFDPKSRVPISSETTESSSTDNGGGTVTVASNLPEGNGTKPDDRRQNSETRERINYEVSETERQTVTAGGEIVRLTVAVLVNTDTADEAELATLGDLVGSAVGFDPSRGDSITVKAMPFAILPQMDATDTTSFLTGPLESLDLMSLIRLGVLAIVTLGIGLFVVRPILASQSSNVALPAPTEPTDPKPIDPIDQLRLLIESKQDEAMGILHEWLEDSEAGVKS